MVVAEEYSPKTVVPCIVQGQKNQTSKPRLAHVEYERLVEIVRRKGLNISDTQLLVAAYTGCDLFFDDGVETD